MYEYTLYDSIFAFGFFGKLFFALAVFAASLGLSSPRRNNYRSAHLRAIKARSLIKSNCCAR